MINMDFLIPQDVLGVINHINQPIFMQENHRPVKLEAMCYAVFAYTMHIANNKEVLWVANSDDDVNDILDAFENLNLLYKLNMTFSGLSIDFRNENNILYVFPANQVLVGSTAVFKVDKAFIDLSESSWTTSDISHVCKTTAKNLRASTMFPKALIDFRNDIVGISDEYIDRL